MPQPVLGIDYGRARIGVAISDELRMLAHPLETIAAGPGALRRIVEIVRERKVSHVVVGVPKTMSGQVGPAAAEAEAFIKSVRGKLPCPVTGWDERLTTVAAQRALHEAGRNTRQSRKIIDQVAAQMILQSFLDSEAAPASEEPEPG
jgi:putative Holliday junction resolvase